MTSRGPPFSLCSFGLTFSLKRTSLIIIRYKDSVKNSCFLINVLEISALHGTNGSVWEAQ